MQGIQIVMECTEDLFNLVFRKLLKILMCTAPSFLFCSTYLEDMDQSGYTKRVLVYYIIVWIARMFELCAHEMRVP